MEKPSHAAEYSREHTALVRATCLYVATKLGDLMDGLVVIGGLVPSLLIRQENLPPDIEPHVGTLDIDIGLTLGFLEEKRYRDLTERLRRARFSSDLNDRGNPARYRWRLDASSKITIDFLIPPSLADDRGGKLRNIEPDFAAVIAPGLRLAFEDRQQVELSGETIFGEHACRDVWTCGPGAYVVLKALAFHSRGENKDAYDLYYVLRNYGSGVEDVIERLAPFVADSEASEALDVLSQDFRTHNALGPMRVAEFLTGSPDDAIQAEVVSLVQQVLREVR